MYTLIIVLNYITKQYHALYISFRLDLSHKCIAG